MRYRTILFDVDGTLLDSNDAHAHAWVDAFAEHDVHVSFERVRPLVGMGGDKVLRLIADIDDESARGRKIGSRRKAIFRDRYLGNLRPTPGARDLVSSLADRGLTVAVATSAQPDEVDDLLRAAHIDD